MARNSAAAASSAILANYGKEIKSHKDTMAEAINLGRTLTSGGVMQRMMGLAFLSGVIARQRKMAAFNFADTFDGFAAGWYGKGNGLGRAPLDAKARKTLIGGYQHFTNAGLRGDDWKPLVVGIMEMTNTPVSSRGAKIGALLEKDEWQTKAPDADAIAIATGKKKKRGGAKGKPRYNLKGKLRGICSNGEDSASNDEFIAALKDKPTYAALVRDYFEAIAAIRAKLAEDEQTGSANIKVWKTAVNSTLKAANRLPRAAGKRAN